ncbi:hypothetical protein R1sor_024650 [Riccia sorocarpa]|uniref:Transmembrane protein n=1 Tax=Riccia sorocarpa TaxID=122646 RepID=A0ABD3GX60_9MARC
MEMVKHKAGNVAVEWRGVQKICETMDGQVAYNLARVIIFGASFLLFVTQAVIPDILTYAHSKSIAGGHVLLELMVGLLFLLGVLFSWTAAISVGYILYLVRSLLGANFIVIAIPLLSILSVRAIHLIWICWKHRHNRAQFLEMNECFVSSVATAEGALKQETQHTELFKFLSSLVRSKVQEASYGSGSGAC